MGNDGKPGANVSLKGYFQFSKIPEIICYYNLFLGI